MKSKQETPRNRTRCWATKRLPQGWSPCNWTWSWTASRFGWTTPISGTGPRYKSLMCRRIVPRKGFLRDTGKGNSLSLNQQISSFSFHLSGYRSCDSRLLKQTKQKACIIKSCCKHHNGRRTTGTDQNFTESKTSSNSSAYQDRWSSRFVFFFRKLIQFLIFLIKHLSLH